ncbi:MAG: hypothetical protein ACXIT9_07250 [Nitritalea sp.]
MMKNTLYTAFLALLLLAFGQSCIEADDLVTPSVEAPVLLLLSGNQFQADAPVSVETRVYTLDKTHILDHTRGIDSIPVAGLSLQVFLNPTTQIGTLETDAQGRGTFTSSWSALGLTTPRAGSQVRLEFAGQHKGINFRRYHTVRVQ